MPRLRFSVPEQPGALRWQDLALVLATVFFHPLFWMNQGNGFSMFLPLVQHTLLVEIAALLAPALFFLAPALLLRRSGCEWPELLEQSLGTLPALAIRCAACVFLVLWLASLLEIPGLWWLNLILRADAPRWVSVMVTAALLAFAALTAFQSTRTSARLARFTIALGSAMILAGAIRVREGWPDAIYGFDNPTPLGAAYAQGLSELLAYAAPPALLASAGAGRLASAAEIRRLALFGLALPLFAVVLALGFIAVATWESPLYQPSLNPDLAMAWWAKAAGSAIPPRMLLVAVTMFGALRFGLRALAGLVQPKQTGDPKRHWGRLLPLAALILYFACQSTYPELLSRGRDVATSPLVALAAILTAHLLVPLAPLRPARRLDLTSTAAFVVALAGYALWTPCTGLGSWTQTWILPVYALAFAVALGGRLWSRRRSEASSAETDTGRIAGAVVWGAFGGGEGGHGRQWG